MRALAVRLLRFLNLLLWVAAMGSTHALAGETIRINGSGTGLEMMKPLLKAYATTHPRVSFVMNKPLGSSGAIKALAAGALDLAVSSKPLKPEEAAQGLKLSPYGRTPLVIVAGRNVPAQNISTEELEAIYSGSIRKWPNKESIRVVLRPLEDIDTKILRGLSPGMDAAIGQAQSLRGMLTAVTDPESNLLVATTQGSIGTSGLAGVLVEHTTLRVLALNGVEPSIAALTKGSYPLVKELHFVTRTQTSEPTLRFLEFVYSPKGRAIVERVGVLTTTGGR
jgi:phosphate transport system substrate-binding protein